MSLIRIHARDTASALAEVARRFGADALIVSTTQRLGGVEVAVAQASAHAPGVPCPRPDPGCNDLPELPSRLLLIGPPGAGVSMLAARLAAHRLRQRQSGAVQLVAPRPDLLAPVSSLVAHCRLLGLAAETPIWRNRHADDLPEPEAGCPQIIDLSGLAQQGPEVAPALLGAPGAECWLVLPTALHAKAHELVVPTFRQFVSAVALTRADLCPPTADDHDLPQRFGLPIAVVSQGSGLLDALRPPDTAATAITTPDRKDVPHVATRLSR